MVNKIYVALTAAAILFGSGVAASADDIGDVLQTLKSQNVDVLCRKADAAKGIFSLRSFEGRLCKSDYIAAFAELTCSGVSDYSSSGCAKEAKKSLAGRRPQEVLQAAVLKHAGKAAEFVCASYQKSNNKALKALAAAAKC